MKNKKQIFVTSLQNRNDIQHIVSDLFGVDTVVHYGGSTKASQTRNLTHHIYDQSVVIDVFSVAREVASVHNLTISMHSPVIMPWHYALSSGKRNTPSYFTLKDKAHGMFFSLADLGDTSFSQKFLEEGKRQNEMLQMYGKDILNLEHALEDLQQSYKQIKDHISDTNLLLRDLFSSDTEILCTSIGGIHSPKPMYAIGVFTPYMISPSRLQTEIYNDDAEKIRSNIHASLHDHIGWLDIPYLQYQIKKTSVDDLIIANLSALIGIDEICMATKYLHMQSQGILTYEERKNMPVTLYYETFFGWQKQLKQKVSSQQKVFMQEIEKAVDSPLRYVIPSVDSPMLLKMK